MGDVVTYETDADFVDDLPRQLRLAACAGSRLSLTLTTRGAMRLARRIEDGERVRIVEVKVDVVPVWWIYLTLGVTLCPHIMQAAWAVARVLQ